MECVILPPKKSSPDGGIGRRSRLKICRSQGCAGSIPVPGTKASQIMRSFFIFPAP